MVRVLEVASAWRAVDGEDICVGAVAPHDNDSSRSSEIRRSNMERADNGQMELALELRRAVRGVLKWCDALDVLEARMRGERVERVFSQRAKKSIESKPASADARGEETMRARDQNAPHAHERCSAPERV